MPDRKIPEILGLVGAWAGAVIANAHLTEALSWVAAVLTIALTIWQLTEKIIKTLQKWSQRREGKNGE